MRELDQQINNMKPPQPQPHSHSNKIARLVGFAAEESRNSAQQFKHGAVLCKGGKKYVAVTTRIRGRHIEEIYVAAFTRKWAQ